MSNRDLLVRELALCVWCGANIRNVRVYDWMPRFCSSVCARRYAAFEKFIGDLDHFIRLRPEGGGW